jgi:hypothetical protein
MMWEVEVVKIYLDQIVLRFQVLAIVQAAKKVTRAPIRPASDAESDSWGIAGNV